VSWPKTTRQKNFGLANLKFMFWTSIFKFADYALMNLIAAQNGAQSAANKCGKNKSHHKHREALRRHFQIGLAT
jgi:hypothetical protein